MTPNKIYLGIQELDMGYVYNLSLDNNGEPEYIRKDSLLEWAKEMKEQAARRPHRNPADGIQCLGKQQAFDALIDKLNEM